MRHFKTFLAAVFAGLSTVAAADTGKLVVHVDQPGIKISPMLYGMMTEEINHCYDGGLYAELIQNRAFKDDPASPIHWTVAADPSSDGVVSLDRSDPATPALPVSLKMEATAVDPGKRFGIANDGYWGIPVKPKTDYHASFFAKAAAGFDDGLTVAIESADGKTKIVSAVSEKIGPDWKRYTVTLHVEAADASTKNRFVISTGKPGTVWVSLVSLFPPTYTNRPNGLRVDLMQKMDDMHPAFLRLPGGNYLEGNSIAEHFPWKLTLGDVSTRPGHPCCWGYPSTDGMGLMEYLLWCEDLHMEPVLGVFAGYALNGEHVEPGEKLQPFVQEALDEIEYVTGDKATTWGAKRAADGHPEPFKMTYVEISNEDGRFNYDGRYAQFYDAIKMDHPALQLIATSPVHSRVADLVDDHYYRAPAEMARDSGHYDHSKRGATKVFVGEWASMDGNPTPTLLAALGDAAWMTGMERNSDLVTISAYAPLLVNVNPGAAQWPTNLIGYDALTSFGSPSYYAQRMFYANRGDTLLPTDVTPVVDANEPKPVPHGMVGVGTYATTSEYKDVKVVAGDKVFQPDINGKADQIKGNWSVVDNAIRQTGDGTDCLKLFGNDAWTDYTLTMRARKLGGNEGFLIPFHVRDAKNMLRWNVGGWGNTQTAIERDAGGSRGVLGDPSAMSVDTGRWYDIRIELRGTDIKCYLDDKLVTTATDVDGPVPPVYAVASRVDASGDVILKVVNFGKTPQKLEVSLPGAPAVSPAADCEVLTGRPEDVNTIADPEKVAPKQVPVTDAGPSFTHEFPAYSVSVMKLRTK